MLLESFFLQFFFFNLKQILRYYETYLISKRIEEQLYIFSLHIPVIIFILLWKGSLIAQRKHYVFELIISFLEAVPVSISILS
jgi:hypothetical protein